MKTMISFLTLNLGWILLATVGCILIYFAAINLKKPAPEIPATKSVNFSEDSVVSNPVATHPWVNVFKEAAYYAIYQEVNPWDYLKENWEKVANFNGSVEKAMLDFITNEAHRQIPDSSTVTLSIRDYEDENSVIMEYRDPKTDSIMVTTGHDPEICLYGTFANKKGESKTFKLICANGLVGELGGKTTTFEEDYEIKFGDSFIGLTGSNSFQAASFAKENGLPVRFIVEGMIESKTPDMTRVKVFGDYKKFKKGIFDVVIQPGDILRKKEGRWLYIKTK